MNSWLSLAEVQVFGVRATISNKALFGVASRICDFELGFAWKAINGNTDGDWVAGFTANKCQIDFPWWQVDLGDIFKIIKILLWNCTDCCQDKLNSIVLQIIACGRFHNCIVCQF